MKMKKVLIAIAAVVFAITSQAASFEWSAVMITKDPDNKGSALSAYLVDASVLSMADATASLAAGDTSVLSGSAILDTSTTAAAGANLRIANKTGGTTVADKSYTAYFVILNAADPTYFFVSNKEMTGVGQALTNTQFAFGTQAGTSWQAVTAVPEPTSGLLMLVGLGALALRRRRA